MAAITTRSIAGKTADEPKIKPKGKAASNPDRAKAKLEELGKHLGPLSEAKKLLNEALGLL